MKKQNVICLLLSLTLINASIAFSTPLVSFPTDFKATAGSTIKVPVYISDIAGLFINGFAFRIDFDANVLSNPVVITDGTLSQGKQGMTFYNPPSDNIGKLSVGIFSNFFPSQDGIVIYIQFDVASNFSNETPLSFVGLDSKTNLIDGYYNPMDANFQNGTIVSDITKEYQINGNLKFEYPLSGKIYVKAYTNPDDSTPAHEVVYDIFGQSNNIDFSMPVPEGTYYLQAYIDTDNDESPHSEQAVVKLSEPVIVSDSDITLADPMEIPWPFTSDAGVALDMDISTHNYDDIVSTTDIETYTHASLNDEVIVAIVIQNVFNLDSFQVKILFDSSRMAFINAIEDDPSQNIVNILKKNGGETLFQPAIESPGKVNISSSLVKKDCNISPEGSGVLALLKFKVLDSEPDNTLTPVSVLYTDCNDELFKVTQLSGATTQPFMLCDFNKDGIIDFIDLGLLADHWLFKEGDPGWDPIFNVSNIFDTETGKQIIDFNDLAVLGDDENWLKEME
jgi:hypothetical protein